MYDRDDMVRINEVQKDFYESRFEATSGDERAANQVTNVWTKIRRKVISFDHDLGVQDQYLEQHRQWLGDLGDARVLDLGCFSGNRLSLWLAENAREYVGIDLSEQATAVLRQKIAERAIAAAQVLAGDFLASGFPDEHFDAIYAHSVMHHFQNTEVLCKELRRILKPGGRIVSLDPMEIEPINRTLRALYRPFQSDKDWEWPFRRSTLRTIRENFEISAIQGLQGMGKLGYPFLLLPGTGRLGRAIGQWGARMDMRYANRQGPAFAFCWNVSLLLRK